MEFQKKIALRKAFRLVCSVAGIVCITGCSSENNMEQSTADTGQTEATAPAETNTGAATPAADKGIGPVTTVELSATVDTALATRGKTVFESKCTACHKFGERYVGPDLAGVTERRKPEWIMNMILNPQEMVQKDPAAQELLAQFMTQMPNQNLTQEEARAVLEYFRTQKAK